MKRILIDGTCVRGMKDGLSRYIINIVKNLALYYTDELSYTFLVLPNQLSQEEENVIGNVMKIEYINIPPIGLKRDFLYIIYLLRNKSRFDLCYFPSNQYPLFYKGGIYTIHDIIYEQFPQQLGKLAFLKRIYLHLNVRWGILFSKKVVAVSKFTKSEVIEHHHLSNSLSNKINVVYEGWEHLQDINIDYPDTDRIFEKYFFYVGSSRGHKNLDRFVKAYELIVDKLPNGWGCIMTGRSDKLSKENREIIDRINKTRNRLILTEWITDEKMAGYFKKASVFVFPSLSEGFGIPLLEAFYYEIPILCSNNVIFPEIAGNAAIYFDPFSEKDMAEKMLNYAINEKDKKDILISKGKSQLEFYSWKKAANNIYQLIKKS